MSRRGSIRPDVAFRALAAARRAKARDAKTTEPARAETAAEAYARVKADLEAVFSEARRLLDEHAECAARNPEYWNHVGDLNRYATRMRDAFGIKTEPQR